MSTRNIIRAWKNEEYRQSLSAEEKETMPLNPAGLTELSGDQLKHVAGGNIFPTYYLCFHTRWPSPGCRPPE